MILLPKRARSLARNSHLRDHVDPVVDAVSHIVQQHNTNAIEASGYPVLIYKRYTSGQPCSCTKLRSVSGGLSMYDEHGDANPAVIESIRNQAEFGLAEYNSNRLPDMHQDVSMPVSEIGEGPIVEEEPPIQEAPQESFFAGGCGVCFGTGFIGGYSPLGAHRFIGTYTNILSSFGCEIDRTVYPHAMVLSGSDSWVEFLLPARGLPKYQEVNSAYPNTRPSIVNVWDGTRALEIEGRTPDLLVTSRLTGKSAYRLSLYGGRLPNEETVIRVSIGDLQARDSEARLTHLEVLTNYSTSTTLVDIPNLNVGFDQTKATPYQATTMEVSAKVPPLAPWDVVADAVNQQLWRVTSSKPVSPSGHSIWFQTTEITPVEPHWLEARLPLPSPLWLNSTKRSLRSTPGTQLSYSRRGGF